MTTVGHHPRTKGTTPMDLADRTLDRIDGLRDRVYELRHRPRLVLWGGKPGRDIQYGSRRDRERERRREIVAAFGSIPYVFTQAGLAITRAFRPLARHMELVNERARRAQDSERLAQMADIPRGKAYAQLARLARAGITIKRDDR